MIIRNLIFSAEYKKFLSYPLALPLSIYTYIYIYAVMKTICPPGYHHNGFVATHALAHVHHHYLHRTSCAQVHELAQSYCGDNREDTLIS